MRTDRTSGWTPWVVDVVIGVSTVVLDAFAVLCAAVVLTFRNLHGMAANQHRGGPPPPDSTPAVVLWVLTLVAALVAAGFTRARMPVSATLQWLVTVLMVAVSANSL